MRLTDLIENRTGVRIVILRALQLGDLLCAIPALRALRAAYSEAEISLIGLPWSEEFCQRFSKYVDRWIEFPGYPGLPERAPDEQHFPSFLRDMQSGHYDLAIQMQGSGNITNHLLAQFGAAQTAGFFVPGDHCPDPHTYLEYPEGLPEIHRLVGLVEFLGCPPQGAELEFPLSHSNCARAEATLHRFGLVPGEYICVHVGSRSPDRRWEAQELSQAADRLASLGYTIVLTGTAQEVEVTTKVRQCMVFPSVDLTGQTDLGGLAGILTAARLLICNDTGVSHLADALHSPSVVLFSGSDPDRWAPLNRELHPILMRTGKPQAAEIVDLALQVLRQESSYAA
jgi:ADP-heptose:LPS heptosyltransferase